jgi:hypothetical protein
MADPGDLKILKEGVEEWNRFRLYNPDYEIDLTAADLSGADLNGAYLRDANLAKAKLAEARLKGANLGAANLTLAQLGGADLSMANLHSADLSRADLNDVDLYHADLFGAKLEQANLKNAGLAYCTLVRANLTGAILTGARLYGSSRDDWIIRDVECQYVYWDWAHKQRSPKDRDLEPGEFERLYAALPTIEYIFEHGMSPLDPLIMDRVVQAIRNKRPEFDIKIDSISARGLAPSVKFTVQHEEDKEPALKEVRKQYEAKLKQLESERDRYWQVIKSAFDKPTEVKLISAGPGAIVATDGSTVNIQQHINYALELQKAIAAEPERSQSFAKVAKKTALDIIGGGIKDIAKGQVKEAANQIIQLGKDLGPIVAKTAAYGFFANLC